MSLKPNSPDDSKPIDRDQGGISGVWVVVWMFAFGIAATGALFAYWHFHTAPFRDLQAALAAEFEGSRPRVEGGRRKQHKDTPNILRIVLKVEFHPEKDSGRAEEAVAHVMEVAAKNHDLTPYDIVEIHLYWPEKEQKIHERVFERRLD